jgi:hypothetical protein
VQIGSLRDQLFRQLREAGFIPTEAKLLNANVGNTHLLRCVICAALYPNVARLTQKGDSGDLVTISESVSFHPSSVNTRQSARSDRWFVYLEKVETSKVFLRDSTAVSAYALLLFGGQVDVVHDRDRIVVDRCVTLALHVHCSNEGRAEESGKLAGPFLTCAPGCLTSRWIRDQGMHPLLSHTFTWSTTLVS